MNNSKKEFNIFILPVVIFISLFTVSLVYFFTFLQPLMEQRSLTAPIYEFLFAPKIDVIKTFVNTVLSIAFISLCFLISLTTAITEANYLYNSKSKLRAIAVTVVIGVIGVITINTKFNQESTELLFLTIPIGFTIIALIQFINNKKAIKKENNNKGDQK